ncbi:hypothetical protein DNTS_035427 [Danionella cerebrum]|uniref:PDZ domain-containing protein n=1 Tax=Danionella cerebrum TaxID=2873325 RepID=A0A553MM42_9TELE|nr:hypothetical protein DNTS_035427 [Danionella translucida]
MWFPNRFELDSERKPVQREECDVLDSSCKGWSSAFLPSPLTGDPSALKVPGTWLLAAIPNWISRDYSSVAPSVMDLRCLVPALRPLVLWMSNSIELLHFIQHEVPLLLTWRQQEQRPNDTESWENQIQATRGASEEAMTVLEEVIMFTFQQTVYYLTKMTLQPQPLVEVLLLALPTGIFVANGFTPIPHLKISVAHLNFFIVLKITSAPTTPLGNLLSPQSLYVVLPRLLDSSPLWEEGQLHLSPGLCPIMDILKETLQLLNMFQVHQEISSQLLSYLFFFSNASLFNMLMERGSGGDFYQWSRGVQIRANLDLLMDWTQGVGLGLLAAEFFQKFSSAVNLLASPKETLLQASWSTLRAEFVHLNPAQLHHMLREYHPSRSCPPHWVPSPEDAAAALQTSHILESFDDHPPLILPSSTFHLELGKPITDEGLFAPLKRLQEFIQTLAESATLPQLQAAQQRERLDSLLKEVSLRMVTEVESLSFAGYNVWQLCFLDFCSNHNGDVQASEAIPCLDPQESKPHDSMTPPQVRGSHTRLSSCEDVLKQKLKCLELQNSLSGDTEQCYHKSLALDPSCLLTPPNTPQSLDLAELDTSLQEGARQLKRENGVSGNTEHRSDEEEDDRDEVFTVELQRGPHGLGLALVDGLKTPLRVSGMYVKSVVPDSPAALTQRLRVGDRILAVNGVSLVGMDYYSGREVIRTSGDVLRLLVAKTESMSSARSCITRC